MDTRGEKLLKIYFLRNLLYKYRFSVLDNSKFNNVIIKASKSLKIEFNNNIIGPTMSRFDRPSMLKLNTSIEFHNNAFIRSCAIINTFDTPNFILREELFINQNSLISEIGRLKIQLGTTCAISWNVNLLAYDFHCIIFGYNDKSFYGDIIIPNNLW